jgi:hypothetical protein
VKDLANAALRYYQLRLVAIEIFTIARTSVFVDLFDPQIAMDVLNLIWFKLKPPNFGQFIGTKPTSIIKKITLKARH